MVISRDLCYHGKYFIEGKEKTNQNPILIHYSPAKVAFCLHRNIKNIIKKQKIVMVFGGDEIKTRKFARLLSKSTEKCESASIRLHHSSQISFASVTEVERRCVAQVASVAAMNVNVLPLVVALVPDAGLLGLMSVSVTLSVINERKG